MLDTFVYDELSHHAATEAVAVSIILLAITTDIVFGKINKKFPPPRSIRYLLVVISIIACIWAALGFTEVLTGVRLQSSVRDYCNRKLPQKNESSD